MTADPRRHSTAADRNRGPLLDLLTRVLPPTGLALEIASGTGQHVAHFAAGLPGWRWQPSDPDPGARASIAAWCAGYANVLPPLDLDVMAPDWPGAPDRVDAVACANMIHISPLPTCAALMNGAARHLAPAGVLLVYGPFLVEGEPTAASNLAFDADLRARNPAWGLRRLGDVQAVAGAAGLVLRERVAMPANNLTLVFARQA
jgi:hypothetical protein